MQSRLRPDSLWNLTTACRVGPSIVPVTVSGGFAPAVLSISWSSSTAGSVCPARSIGRAFEPVKVGEAAVRTKRER